MIYSWVFVLSLREASQLEKPTKVGASESKATWGFVGSKGIHHIRII